MKRNSASCRRSRITLTFTEKQLQQAHEAHYCVTRLAEIMQRQPRQLEREFQRRYGITPRCWLVAARFSQALRFLHTADPIKVVALNLLYKHPDHFCRDFKRACRVTPSDFRLVLPVCRILVVVGGNLIVVDAGKSE